MKLKIALIHNIIAPYRIPLFEELAAHPSIDLTVYFCSETHKNRKWNVLRDVNFHYEILPGILFQPGSITININPVIISKIKHGQFDVVIIGGCADITCQLAYYQSKFLNIPVILWSEANECAVSNLGKIFSPFTKYIIKKADAIINPGILAKMYSIKNGANDKKIFLAPNTINNQQYFEKSDLFRNNKEFFKEKNDLKRLIIIFVGQIIDRKGIQYLISSFEKLVEIQKDISLIIVGDGERKAEIQSYCSKNNIQNVHFTGWVDEEKKIRLYSISDIFVLPTLSDLAPLVLNEAMACSLPIIITSKTGNAPDFVKNGENGYIVEPKDVDQLTDAISRIILENSDNHMGKRSREIIETNITIERSVAGFIEAINYVRKTDYKNTHDGN